MDTFSVEWKINGKTVPSNKVGEVLMKKMTDEVKKKIKKNIGDDPGPSTGGPPQLNSGPGPLPRKTI